MDYQEIRTLKILEEMDKDEVPSQRHIARELNISLGLVNSFIKRLVNKGYFKVTHIPANRVKYILTPKGAAEKARLTYAYIKYSFDFYKTARGKLRDLFFDLYSQNVESVVLFGNGDLAEIAYLSLQEFPIKLVAVVDTRNAGMSFMGFTVLCLEDLTDVSFDKIIITYDESIIDSRKFLINMGVREEKIVFLGTLT